jgi:hypothetical protein
LLPRKKKNLEDTLMRSKPLQLLLLLLLSSACCVPAQRPSGLLPGERPAATLTASDVAKSSDDPNIAEPESGTVAGGTYDNKYFALSYPLPPNWTEAVKGPPPSDVGYYVLHSFKLPQAADSKSRGTILIAAWDLFFVPRPARNALELVQDIQKNLPEVYQVEVAPAEVKVAGHSFVRFDYGAPAAQLHWRVLATEIRCHMVEFVLTGRDVGILDGLMQHMNKLGLPEGADAKSGTGGGSVPLCIKDYATGPNVIRKVDPAMADPRFTNVPVRVIVGADGKARHIHVINASPEQAKSVKNALAQWSFKPYTRNGTPVEVETGILFKFPPEGAKLPPVPEKY